jgi:hypothetical protein
MAIPTIKATYTVDVETKRTLDRLAVRWAVSRSEALRRAIRQAAGRSAGADRLAALNALQARAGLDKATAARWTARQRRERRAAAAARAGRRTRFISTPAS